MPRFLQDLRAFLGVRGLARPIRLRALVGPRRALSENDYLGGWRYRLSPGAAFSRGLRLGHGGPDDPLVLLLVAA
jgi:hypothetical protein